MVIPAFVKEYSSPSSGGRARKSAREEKGPGKGAPRRVLFLEGRRKKRGGGGPAPSATTAAASTATPLSTLLCASVFGWHPSTLASAASGRNRSAAGCGRDECLRADAFSAARHSARSAASAPARDSCVGNRRMHATRWRWSGREFARKSIPRNTRAASWNTGRDVAGETGAGAEAEGSEGEGSAAAALSRRRRFVSDAATSRTTRDEDADRSSSPAPPPRSCLLYTSPSPRD